MSPTTTDVDRVASSEAVAGTISAPDAFTEAILASHAPWLAFDASGDLTAYLTILAQMYEPIAQIAMDRGFPSDPGFVPGWSALLDPDACPDWALPFCAQFNGTVVNPGADPTWARATIKAEAGFQRGTAPAIIASAQRYLSATQSCVLLERVNVTGNSDAYYFVLVVRPEEILDQNALVAAVNSTKPGGVMWTLVATDSWTITQMEGSQATLTALEGAFSTLLRLEQDIPG